MREMDQSVSYDNISLAGSLTLPDAEMPCPLVICAHGTGNHDRNEGVLHVFDAIAHHLAENGVATYRFDKRGAGQSDGNPAKLGYWDYFSDFQAVFDHFDKQRPHAFTHIVALGHSEGTIMSAELATRRQVDAVVLLAPFYQEIEDILVAQAAEGDALIGRLKGFPGFMARLVTKLTGSPSQQQRRLIDRIKSSDSDVIRFMMRKVPAKHLRELMQLDPKSTYAALKQSQTPTLIIGGGKDAQCSPADVQAIADTLGDLADAHLLPDLSHLLRNDAGTGSFDTYKAQLKKPVEPEVLQLVSHWLQRFVA